MKYMNTVKITESPLEPTYWYPGGNTLGCRNYYQTSAMNANWQRWGLTQSQMINSCLAIGPADGNPARVCVDAP